MESLDAVSEAVAARKDVGGVLGMATDKLWQVPRVQDPGSRPVVGVTGDLYSRTNSVGNARLFQRLELMGCEAWPSPFFATTTDLVARLEGPRFIEHGYLRAAAMEGLAWAVTGRARYRLTRNLSPKTLALAVEPPVDELIRLAHPFVGRGTNYLIVLTAAKIVDFLRRGAAGVINAAGLNCAVATAAASVIPTIRAEFKDAPIITLIYGTNEAPSQQLRLETFVEQLLASQARR